MTERAGIALQAPDIIMQRWFAAVDHSGREALLSRPPVPRRLASHPPVLVRPNGQFEMTANIALQCPMDCGSPQLCVCTVQSASCQ